MIRDKEVVWGHGYPVIFINSRALWTALMGMYPACCQSGLTAFNPTNNCEAGNIIDTFREFNMAQ